MKNVWLVFKRDILRLLKVPPALMVILFLIVLPSIYTWYNVAGFWNPYDNTSAMRVCVVNEDVPASSDLTGEIDVGSQVVKGLEENDQLDWQFVNRTEAMNELNAGACYAVFVIPSDFSERLIALTEGKDERPSIQYYVNEKTGPVAPKITDTGSNTLDRTVNAEFVGTVSKAAVSAIDGASGEMHDALKKVRSKALEQMDSALDALALMDSSIAQVDSAIGQAKTGVSTAHDKLGEATGKLDEAAKELKNAADQGETAANALNTYAAQGLVSLGKTTAYLSQTITKTSSTIATGLSDISKAKGSADLALAEAKGIVEHNQALIDELTALCDALPDSSDYKEQLRSLVASLDSLNKQTSETVSSLQDTSTQMGKDIETLKKANEDFSKAAFEGINNAQSMGTKAFTETIPQVSAAITKLSRATADLSSTVAEQKALVPPAQAALDELNATLDIASTTLSETRSTEQEATEELAMVRNDVVSLSTAGFLERLLGQSSLDSSQIAQFVASPTLLKTEELYTVDSYGAAMAPLFMNLTFWIGAFMLLIIMKQEVDGRGIRHLRIWQRYLGRFLLMALLVVLQAIICVSGLLFMGITPVNIPALYLAAAMCSLAYLSIIYCLSVTLQHVGKGICIILVFAQIPGATGLYPIEMTSPFFQAIYPFFPFTYGIGAMREAMCGFYGNDFAFTLTMLSLFFVIFMGIGLALRPRLANVNRMFARQIEEGDIYNGESAVVPARRYRMSQVVAALADHDLFQQNVQERYERFTRLYPRLMRATIALGILVPIVFTVAFSLTMTEKIVLLTAWLIWFALVCGFLIIVEELRYSMRRQLQLDSMDSEKLRTIYADRKVERYSDSRSLHEDASLLPPKRGGKR